MQSGNTNYGYRSLQYNTKGSHNSAFGAYASRNTDSSWNTSIGTYSNTSNINGISNIAIGTNSLLLNTQGSYNTAIGAASLLNNKSNSNTSIGSNSMQSTTTGSMNVAVGVQSGYNNTTGSKNVFLGTDVGLENTIGSENVFLGYNSGSGFTNNNQNTFLGANTTNTNNYSNATVIGYESNILIPNGITLGTMTNKVLIPGTGYINTIDSGQEIATQSYVNEYAVTGLNLLKPCACATVENIVLGPTTTDIVIDGYNVQEGDAVLVKSQNASEPNENTSDILNGIYIYNYNNSIDASYTRAPYASSGSAGGQSTFIRNGDLNKGILFRQTYDEAIIDVNSLKYTKIVTIQFPIGNGLEIVGNQLSVKQNLTDSNENPFLTNVDISNVNISKKLEILGSSSYIKLPPNKTLSSISNINTLGGKKLIIQNVSDQGISMTGAIINLDTVNLSSKGLIPHATYLMVGKYMIRNETGSDKTYSYVKFDLSSNQSPSTIPDNDPYLVQSGKQTIIHGTEDYHTIPFSFLVDSDDFSNGNMYLLFQGLRSSTNDSWRIKCIMHATRLG
jgi:hypothetical protein